MPRPQKSDVLCSIILYYEYTAAAAAAAAVVATEVTSLMILAYRVEALLAAAVGIEPTRGW